MTEQVDEPATLSATWSSTTYAKMQGTMTFTVWPSTSDMFVMNCDLRYSEKSSFLPGVRKSFKLNAIRLSGRINAQSELGPGQQLLLTITADTPCLGGFYSSIIPIDCGTLKPIDRGQWVGILKIHV